jgi:hypothetical protein
MTSPLTSPRRRLVLSSLAALTLAGCGGGGGSDPAPAPVAAAPAPGAQAPVAPVAPAPSAVVVSGVAATGAAFSGGVVTVTDSTGAVVGTSAAVGDDGVFSVTLTLGAKAPIVLVAERAAINGQVERLVSVASGAGSGTATANLTPVTTLIAALLSPSGDPAKLAAEVSAGTAQVSAAAVASKVEQVQALLAPLLTATNTTATDPLTGQFTANGTGYDRLLDSVRVSIAPASATTSNIEVAVKQQAAEGAAPAAVSFTSASTAAVQLPAVDASTLVAEGTSVKITRFLGALSACYALPLADRVNGVVGNATAVVGTAADVKAPACRGLFVGADPANYLSNGLRVGRDASNNGAFASLFRKGADGVVFSQGSYEFTRGNGDLVVGYKSRDSAGNEAYDTLVVRLDNNDGQLKLVGNQYAYPGGVVPYQQVRQFITLNQSAYDYRSTGFVVNVDNKTDGAGNPVFDRVEVSTPRGGTLVLKPTRGYSYLGLVKGASTLGTNFLRLRSAFINPQTTGTLATMEPGLFFASTPVSEDELAAVPAQSVWTYRYFLAGNTSATPDAVQTYKTRARALTLGELSQKTLSALAPAVIANLQAMANPTFGTIPLPTTGPADTGNPATGSGWTVPAGALPTTSLSIYGSYQGAGFNDVANFGSTARTTTVACSAATASDHHCSTTTSGAFATGAVASGVHLWARDSAGREYANFYAAYKLTLP